jgi:hypothetical protein
MWVLLYDPASGSTVWTMFDPKGLKVKRPEKKESKDDDSEETKRDVEKHNNNVDRLNKQLDKLQSTPSGSALYDKLDSMKEEFTFRFGKNGSKVDRGTTEVEVDLDSIEEKQDLGFAVLGHELIHTFQNARENSKDAPTFKQDMDNPDINSQIIDLERQKSEFAGGVDSGLGFSIYDQRDNFDSQEFGDKTYWREQQAVRYENVIKAERMMQQDPSQTPESLRSNPNIRNVYSNIDRQRGPYPSLHGNHYGTYKFDKNPN